MAGFYCSLARRQVLDFEFGSSSHILDDLLNVAFPNERHLHENTEHILILDPRFASKRHTQACGRRHQLGGALFFKGRGSRAQSGWRKKLFLAGALDAVRLLGRQADSLLFLNCLLFYPSEFDQSSNVSRAINEIEISAVCCRLQNPGGCNVLERSLCAHALSISIHNVFFPATGCLQCGLPSGSSKEIFKGRGYFRTGIVQKPVDVIEHEVDDHFSWTVLNNRFDFTEPEPGPTARIDKNEGE